MIPCFQLNQADVSIPFQDRSRVAAPFISHDVMEHSPLGFELLEKLMEEAIIKLCDDLLMFFREIKGELGIVGKFACFFVDLFNGVVFVVGLEETVSPGAHDCGRLVRDGILTIREAA